MKAPEFNEVVAAVMALVAVAVTAYLAILGNETAAGVLGAIVAAAVGFYLRGRVEKAGPVEPGL